jgi:lipopolysaccharide transport system ATP-binding protein
MEEKEVLVKVEGLSKKFCKDLKTSLWYGVKDLISNIHGNKNERLLRNKEFWAVKDINFELRRGECLGLIGHNGAGKSTLLKILNGLINPDAGKVTIKGRVGALIELGAGFNPILSGRENIYNNGAVLGFTKKEIAAKVEDIIDFSEIREFIDMPVQNYSSGMKVRLGFAVAAQMEPDVLIIDEVLAVGDVAFRMKCYKRILELIENTAVIFVSHNLGQILRVCTFGMTMNYGEMKYIGDLSKAITIYEEQYLNIKIQDIKSDESIKKVAYIESIDLTDENGIIKNEFSTGDNVCLNIKLVSKVAILKSRLRICLESINIGPLGGFSSPLSNIFIDLLPNTQKEIKVLIKNIPLQIGSYNVIVGWYGDNEPVIDVKNFGTSLNITSPEIKMLAYGSDGLILFQHEWIES